MSDAQGTAWPSTHLHLGLPLVVECGPRGYGTDRLAYCRRTLDDNLAGVRALG